MAKDVLKIAAGEIGNTESPPNSNRTKYGAWYGLDGNPWCMMFVQWCFDQAGLKLPRRTASCSDMLSWYRKYQPERVVTNPKRGDIIIYNFGHTGIVESVAAGTITAIEGNTSAGNTGSQSNGGGVFRRKRSKTLVTAFIRPFDNLDIDKEEDDMVTYKNLNDVPSWYKPAVQKCIKKGALKGTGNGELNISEDMCRVLTVLDNLGKLE